MEVKLTAPAVVFLHTTLVRPWKLMPEHSESCVQPYPVDSHEAALEIATVVNWLEKKVLKKDPASGKAIASAYSGPINDLLVKRLGAVLHHYRTWGLLTHNCIPYLELVYGLSGKDLYQDLPSVDGK